MKTLKIGTRASRLAMWQAEHISARLREAHDGLNIELVPITTKGDKVLDVPLYKVGGKGLFIKELEEAMLRGDFDLAVHSMKDVPGIVPAGFELACVPEREDPRDAFLSRTGCSFADLPEGAVVGTSSPRRAAQLLFLRPDLEMRTLRGNVETRIRKMREGEYDAIILAAAGMKRLELADQITELLSPEQFVPAVGQGALSIEIRAGEADLRDLLQPLQHRDSTDRTDAERGFLATVEGGCQVPIAGHARLEGDEIIFDALIAGTRGTPMIRGQERGPRAEARDIGVRLARRLLDEGGREVLQACMLDD